MKYSNVTLTWGPKSADSLSLSLDKINVNTRYLVKSISGLEPPQVNISVADIAAEGGVYQGRRPENREVVMLVTFLPDYTAGKDVATLRKALYQMLSPKLDYAVTMRLSDELGTGWVETWGYIKRIEANIFSKDPEVQITLTCLTPYFEHGLYTHPNPSLLNGKNSIELTNEGDAPTGFCITFGLLSNRANWKISNQQNTKWIQFNYSFLSGDRIWINTIAENRYATLVRSGSPNRNLLQDMTMDSTWLQLDGGVNTIGMPTVNYVVDQCFFTSRHWGF